MLLPDKHITLAESLLGLGAFILEQLDRPRPIDDLHNRVIKANDSAQLPAFHDYQSVTLAVLFLFMIDAVEMTDSGDLRLCVS